MIHTRTRMHARSHVRTQYSYYYLIQRYSNITMREQISIQFHTVICDGRSIQITFTRAIYKIRVKSK